MASNPVTSFTSRYGSPVVDQGGARIRAHCRHVATVVTISGRLDSSNIEAAGTVAKRFVLPDKPIVLDLSEVTEFAPEAMELLQDLDDACGTADVDWALIVGDTVARALAVSNGVQLPVVSSVAQALHDFDDEILDRRRFLLPLLGKTA